MTPQPPPSAIQTTSASSNVDYDTSTEAAAATTPTEAPQPPSPSTEDPHDECVLCCYPHPLKPEEIIYRECCGESICMGCIIAQRRTLIIGTNVEKPIAGSKEEVLEFFTIMTSEEPIVCPFCRAADSTNDKEILERLWNQIDEYKNPRAMRLLGNYYLKGEFGLSKKLKKAEELFQHSYDLGDPIAAYDLANLYNKHIPDQAREIKYLEEGATRGDAPCMNVLGVRAAQSGNHEEAKRQFMTAACAGDDKAVHNLMLNYRVPGSVVSKDDLATTLRAHKAVNDKGKSEPREYAIRHQDFLESEKVNPESIQYVAKLF